MGSEEEIFRAEGVKGVKIRAESVRVKKGVGALARRKKERRA